MPLIPSSLQSLLPRHISTLFPGRKWPHHACLSIDCTDGPAPSQELGISLAPSEEDELAPIKARILAAGNISSPFSLSVGALRSDSDLLVALRVLVATPTELKQYASAFDGQPLSSNNERRWKKMLKARVNVMMTEAQEQTDIAEDEALLKRDSDAAHSQPAVSNSRLTFRQRMAVVTRLEEKRLLRDVLLELEHFRIGVEAT